MILQSKLALEAYSRQGTSVNHDRVREWVDSLGTRKIIKSVTLFLYDIPPQRKTYV